MPASVATLLFLALVGFLCVRDVRNSPGVSHALWIPFCWLCMIGSRFPSEWLGGLKPDTAEGLLEGSPIDRNAFLALLVAGVVVLLLRKTSWRLFFQNNWWITAFFAYTLVSIFWSDFPLTAFKRWHKVAGHVVMALVVMTEKDPVKALDSLFKRCGYLLILVSILFIKWVPDFGRGYDRWTYKVINVGITTNKNLLGNICLIFGLFFVASLLVRRRANTNHNRLDSALNILLVLAVAWLLNLANSATSLVCLMLGVAVIVMTRVPTVSRRFSTIAIVLCVVLGALQISFNLKDTVIASLNRDTTLTGRTELWGILQDMIANPLFGVGFESFWLGPRVEKLWAIYWWKPNQAHNGYFETYLNIGLIGLTLQIGMMLSCYLKNRNKIAELVAAGREGSRELALARFSLAFLIALTAYNFTEATFKAVHLSFFTFFLVLTQYPIQHMEAAEAVVESKDQPPSRPFGFRQALPAGPAPPALHTWNGQLGPRAETLTKRT